MIDTQAFHRSNPRLEHAFTYCAIRSLEIELDRVKRMSINPFTGKLGEMGRLGVGEGFLYGTLLTNHNTPLSLRSKQKETVTGQKGSQESGQKTSKKEKGA